MEPGEMTVTTENSLVVQTGHVLRGHLVARNLGDKVLRLSFEGPPEFTGIVIDPTSGTHVNGCFRPFGGRQNVIDIVPGGEARIGIVVDTASSEPTLGYAVPPGTWEVQVVALANGRRLLASRLPLIVTSGRVPSIT
jgi:hypothetical protein